MLFKNDPISKAAFFIFCLLSYTAASSTQYQSSRLQKSYMHNKIAYAEDDLPVATTLKWLQKHTKIVISVVVGLTLGIALLIWLLKKKEEAPENSESPSTVIPDDNLNNSDSPRLSQQEEEAQSTIQLPDFIEKIDHISGQPNSIQDKLDQGGLHVILLYRDECYYCIEFLPVYKQLAQAYQGKPVNFGRIKMTDDDGTRAMCKLYMKHMYEDASTSKGLDIRTFPALLMLEKGKIVKVIQGSEEKRKPHVLKKLINQYLQKTRRSVT